MGYNRLLTCSTTF